MVPLYQNEVVMALAFKISESTTLAWHALMLMVNTPENVSTLHIAQTLDVSVNHLSKVLQKLVHFGYIRSVRGPKGGFLLSKPPDEITFLAIYEMFEGPLESYSCLLKRKTCPMPGCPFRPKLNELSTEFKNFLQAKTLAEMRL